MLKLQRLPAPTLSAVPNLSEPLRLINVTGFGRSGSTLLGQLLDKDPDLSFVGEANFVWRIGYLENRLCMCGATFRDCPFWSEVDQRAFGGLSLEAAESLVALERGVVRKRRLVGLLSPGLPHWASAKDVERLVSYRTAGYRAMAAVAGAGWIVDTSKDPIYGLMLSHLEHVELHVVHLVRDPRAVAYSWQRSVARNDVAPTDKAVYLNQLSAERSSWEWMGGNLLASALRRRAASYVLVRYEDLVSEPDTTLARIRQSIGLPPGGPIADDDGVIRLPATTHVIAGNPSRRAGGTEVVLKLDDRWRGSLSRGDERAVLARCGLLMRRYGYSRS